MSKRSLLALFIVSSAICCATPARADLVRSPDADTSAVSLYQFQMAWFSQDKAYHLTASALGAAGVYALGRELGLGRAQSAIVSTVVVGTAGFIRETYHPRDPNLLNASSLSRKDIVWNFAGITLGISLTDLVFGSRWRKKAEIR